MNGENWFSGPTCAEEQELQKKITKKGHNPYMLGIAREEQSNPVELKNSMLTHRHTTLVVVVVCVCIYMPSDAIHGWQTCDITTEAFLWQVDQDPQFLGFGTTIKSLFRPA